MSDVIATLSPSAPRRWFAFATLAILGVLMIFLGVQSQPALHWWLFLVVGGALALWLAERLRRTGARRLVLTEAGIALEDGTLLAPLDLITSLDRGTFAFKPSNGFLLRLSGAQPRLWLPGLVWVWGKRVGVGGITGAGEGKFMAEALAAMLARRGAP